MARRRRLAHGLEQDLLGLGLVLARREVDLDRDRPAGAVGDRVGRARRPGSGGRRSCRLRRPTRAPPAAGVQRLRQHEHERSRQPHECGPHASPQNALTLCRATRILAGRGADVPGIGPERHTSWLLSRPLRMTFEDVVGWASDLSGRARRVGPNECAVPPSRPSRGVGDPGGRRCRRGAEEAAPAADPRGAARGSQRAPARGRRPRGLAAARRRRRRLGQDPGAHPPDRLADLRAQRPPRLDPRDHLHQQGRRRDARAGHRAGRRPRQDHVGQHLPLGLRAHPAQGDRQVRLQVELHDLRRGRLQAADDAGLPRPRPRREALTRRARSSTGSATPRTSSRTTRTPPRTPRTARRRPTPRRTPSTSAASARPTRSTSTTC